MTLVDVASELRHELLGNHVQADNVIATARPYLLSLADRLESQVIVLEDLPTEDPGVAGQLWNDSGVPTVSTG